MIRVFLRMAGMALLAAMLPISPVLANAATGSAVDPTTLLEQIDTATRAGRLVQADAMLSLLEQGNGQDVSGAVALQRAEYHMAKGEVENAAVMLGRAGFDGGDVCRRSRLTGWIAGKTAHWSKAILQLATAVEHCDEDASLWNLLGLALVGKGEFSASLEAFDSALQLEPQHAGLFNNRALARVQAGDLHSAVIDLRQALVLNPDDPAIRANADYLSGAMEIALVRAAGDSDAIWAGRLAKAGEGAQSAGRNQIAMAYFANAALLSDRFDAHIWSQATPITNDRAD